MAETTVRHWTIGAAVALFGTAVAAEPMGDAIHNAGTVGGRERTFIEYVPKTLKPGAQLLFVLHPSGGDASGMREYSKYEFDELADSNTDSRSSIRTGSRTPGTIAAAARRFPPSG
jgi:poly(3-hydroxybutyrate) depolymerase